ncbi:hypothetical protein LCGC14_2212280 [marine sediment metagenome]|uniref:Uncharacterized protein n=1 Tax=marine sediment metagenome TaxID=412755 RepID=A0A0F9E0W4_9ZZZZ
MADNGFNGTQFTFGGTTYAPLRSVNFATAAAKVDVSGSTSATKQYQTGTADTTLSVTVVGTISATVGTSGVAIAAWFDGNSDTIADAVLVSNAQAGSVDGEILTTLEFAPTT